MLIAESLDVVFDSFGLGGVLVCRSIVWRWHLYVWPGTALRWHGRDWGRRSLRDGTLWHRLHVDERDRDAPAAPVAANNDAASMS
jgi:hypothetical protein